MTIALLPSIPTLSTGLVNANVYNLKIVACTFSGYHALKSTCRELFSVGGPMCHLRCTTPILHRRLLGSFADVFAAEARELGLSLRGFDLDLFHAFLNRNIRASLGSG